MATQSRGATTATSLKIDRHRVLFETTSTRTGAAAATFVQDKHRAPAAETRTIPSSRTWRTTTRKSWRPATPLKSPHENRALHHRPSDNNDNVSLEDTQRRERHDNTGGRTWSRTINPNFSVWIQPHNHTDNDSALWGLMCMGTDYTQ